jgi:hypothetical protein
MDFITVLFSPSTTLSRLKKQPEWQLSFVVMCVLVAVHAWLQIPILKQITELQSQGLTEEQSEQMKIFYEIFNYLMVIAAPITLIITLTLSSGYVHVMGIFFGGETKYQNVFAAIVNIHIVKVLAEYLVLLILYMRGIEKVKNYDDLYVLGMNVFFNVKTIGKIPYIILSQITVFEIIYLILLTIGISTLFNLTRMKSAIIASSLWVVALLFEISTDLITFH